jgi:hypothetical protein
LQISAFENLLPIFTDFLFILLTFSVIIFLLGRKISSLLSIRKLLATKDLRLFYSNYSISQAWNYFQKPSFYAEKSTQQDFIDYFTKKAFQKEFFEYSRFLLLGPSGIGKTVALIRLFARWKYALREEAFHIKLISLSGPNIYENIKTIPNQEQTILLVDNLDSAINQSNYRSAVDQLLDATRAFPRVVIACQTGFLPPYMEEESGDEMVKYVGERHFQIFRRVELAPWGQERSIRYSSEKIGLLRFKKRKRARKWITVHPSLFERAGYVNWIPEALLSSKDPVYPYQLIQSAIHGLIGKLKPEAGTKENVFAFLVDLALSIKEQDQSEWLMSIDELAKLTHQYQIEIKHFHYKLLEVSSEGFVRIISPKFLAYFLAWKGFHSHWSLSRTAWKALPETQSYFQQMCWEKLMSKPEIQEQGFCLLDQDTEKKPCHKIKFHQLGRISRLYFKASTTINDWRFLKKMGQLRAIYFQSSTPEELPIQCLRELPGAKVHIYLGDKVLRVNIRQIEEHSPTRPVLHYLDLIYPGQTLSLTQSYLKRRPDYARIQPEELNTLFHTNILIFDKKDYNPHLQSFLQETKTYQQFLSQLEWELFDQAEWHIQSDQSFNLRFSNRHAPTLLMSLVDQVLQDLFELYGEDDYNQGRFNTDDQIQLEEGYWFGRTWAWQVSNSYVLPMQIYMKDPGIVRLEIFGIKGNFVDSPSQKIISTNTSS